MIKCKFENGNNAALRHVTVSAVIIDDNNTKHVLLAKRAPYLQNGGLWCLPGGYLDRNETTEEGICREVFEETGYKVKPVFLLRIIDMPNRPKEDKQNVEFAYLVKAISKEKSIDMETTEIKWFDFDYVPSKSKWAYDHRETFLWYNKWIKKKFNLPVFNNKFLQNS